MEFSEDVSSDANEASPRDPPRQRGALAGPPSNKAFAGLAARREAAAAAPISETIHEQVGTELDAGLMTKLNAIDMKLDELLMASKEHAARLRASRRSRQRRNFSGGVVTSLDSSWVTIDSNTSPNTAGESSINAVGMGAFVRSKSPDGPSHLSPDHSPDPNAVEEVVLRARESIRISHMSDFQARASSAASSMTSTRTGRSREAKQVWQFLEEPESSRFAGYYATIMPFFIVFSVVLTSLQTGTPPLLTGRVPFILEFVVDSVFTVEILVRWFVSPMRVRFLLSPLNLLDMVALICLPMRWLVGRQALYDPTAIVSPEDTYMATFLLCVVPVLRLLKLLRRFETFLLLLHAFKVALEALPVLLFTGSIILLVSAALIFFVEPHSNIDSLPRAMWFVMVTMSTVGYGDISPVSTGGSVITACLFIASALYMAIPLGIVGNAFHRVWEDRDRLLLLRRTRKRLAQWGYTADDIVSFFNAFSTRGDGVLSLDDFRRVIDEMSLGLAERRINDLFQLFDDDCSGTIEPEEFVSILYNQ